MQKDRCTLGLGEVGYIGRELAGFLRCARRESWDNLDSIRVDWRWQERK